MGCSGSKTNDLPLVIRCRERQELIRAAANHRYALAAAHVSYFRSLKGYGDALRTFLDEEMVAASASSSPPPISPLLSKLDTEINSGQSLHLHDDDDNKEEEDEKSYLDISGSSSTEDGGDLEDDCHYLCHGVEKSPPRCSGNVYYMKKSVPPVTTGVPAQPCSGYSEAYWNSAAGYGGVDEYFITSPAKKSPTPPSPKGSALGFLNQFNIFDAFDGDYVGFYPAGDYEYFSKPSSPNWSKVREREEIPELEEDTEQEVYREALKGKRSKSPSSKAVPVLTSTNKSSSKAVPQCKNDRRLKSVPPDNSKNSSRSVLSFGSDKSKKSPMPTERPSKSTPQSKCKSQVAQTKKGDVGLRDETPKSVVPKSAGEFSIKKKGTQSQLEGRSNGNSGSSKLSCVTLLSLHEARDLRNVVAEIRDDFEIVSGYGKEVAMMLEAGKMPHRPNFLKAILSRILYLTAPWLSFMDSSSVPSITLASQSVKLANSYFEDVGKEYGAKVGSLSSTMDKLYAWEKKLYKEVKDEEKLRLMYENQQKMIKMLDGVKSESAKVYAAQVSSLSLLTKLDVRIKAIDVISRKIHKLRDEELQPKIIALIQGMIKMWKDMLVFHQKQFRAISESKIHKFRVNTSSHTNSSSSTITKLENELRAWRHHFNDWISLQKSYVEFLNGWLLQFHLFEPEAAPYSPGQLGAPPIFVICNDWHRAMEAISDRRLSNAMDAFVTGLQKLRGKQDEEECQRLKAEQVSKNYEKLLRTHRMERQRMEVDDARLNLDSVRQSLAEERKKHKNSMKLVQNAATSSLQGGLVPVFKELENFTLKALKSHEQIRLQHPILVGGKVTKCDT